MKLMAIEIKPSSALFKNLPKGHVLIVRDGHIRDVNVVLQWRSLQLRQPLLQQIAGSVVFWMDFIDAPWSRRNPIYSWKANAIIFALDICFCLWRIVK